MDIVKHGNGQIFLRMALEEFTGLKLDSPVILTCRTERYNHCYKLQKIWAISEVEEGLDWIAIIIVMPCSSMDFYLLVTRKKRDYENDQISDWMRRVIRGKNFVVQSSHFISSIESSQKKNLLCMDEIKIYPCHNYQPTTCLPLIHSEWKEFGNQAWMNRVHDLLLLSVHPMNKCAFIVQSNK
jgi:hypothetical protein